MPPGARVLDLGCGRGTLLKMLVDRKGVRGTGIEIVEEKVYDAVAKGVTVYHGDFDEGLSYYPGQQLRLRDPQPDPAGGPGDGDGPHGGSTGGAYGWSRASPTSGTGRPAGNC